MDIEVDALQMAEALHLSAKAVANKAKKLQEHLGATGDQYAHAIEHYITLSAPLPTESDTPVKNLETVIETLALCEQLANVVDDKIDKSHSAAALAIILTCTVVTMAAEYALGILPESPEVLRKARSMLGQIAGDASHADDRRYKAQAIAAYKSGHYPSKDRAAEVIARDVVHRSFRTVRRWLVGVNKDA